MEVLRPRIRVIEDLDGIASQGAIVEEIDLRGSEAFPSGVHHSITAHDQNGVAKKTFAHARQGLDRWNGMPNPETTITEN
jgi:hypothetical protein